MSGIDSRTPISPSTLVALRLRELRQRRAMTGRDLSAQCGTTENVIRNIETGRRGVTVDELFGFAFALNVPPAALLTPSSERPLTVEITDSVAVADRRTISLWVRGEQALPELDEERFSVAAREELPPGDSTSDGNVALQASLGRLMSQLDDQITAHTTRLRSEFVGALTDVTDAVADGLSHEEIAEALDSAVQRLNGSDGRER